MRTRLGWSLFLTSFLDRKCLLLAVHVQQQVCNTVAVTKLIIIPGKRGGEKKVN